MSIYALLKKDHDKVKKYLNQVVELSAEDDKKRDKIFEKIKVEVLAHAKAEAKVFYQPLRKFSKTKEEINHAKKEHDEVEKLLKELAKEQFDKQWLEKFKTFKKNLEHHIKEEEGEIFNNAKEVLDRHVAAGMEADMKKLKAEYKEKLQ